MDFTGYRQDDFWPWFLRQAKSRVITLGMVTTVVFFFFQLTPGDADRIQRFGVPASAAASETAVLHTTWTAPVQDYVSWIAAAVSLDLGKSLRDGTPVGDTLWRHFRVTALLGTTALIFIYGTAIPLGLASAAMAERPAGRCLNTAFGLLYSLPAFWIALLLIIFLCGGDYWRLFPVTGLRSNAGEAVGTWAALTDLAWHMVLPVFCLGYASVGYIGRQVRAAAVECLHSDFILLARAKGLHRRTIMTRHVLPHAVVPAIALLEFFFPALFAGSVVVETLFSIPGMGQLSIESVLARDFPVLISIAFFSALATLAGGLIIESILRLSRYRWEAA